MLRHEDSSTDKSVCRAETLGLRILKLQVDLNYWNDLYFQDAQPNKGTCLNKTSCLIMAPTVNGANYLIVSRVRSDVVGVGTPVEMRDEGRMSGTPTHARDAAILTKLKGMKGARDE